MPVQLPGIALLEAVVRQVLLLFSHSVVRLKSLGMLHSLQSKVQTQFLFVSCKWLSNSHVGKQSIYYFTLCYEMPDRQHTIDLITPNRCSSVSDAAAYSFLPELQGTSVRLLLLTMLVQLMTVRAAASARLVALLLMFV